MQVSALMFCFVLVVFCDFNCFLFGIQYKTDVPHDEEQNVETVASTQSAREEVEVEEDVRSEASAVAVVEEPKKVKNVSSMWNPQAAASSAQSKPAESAEVPKVVKKLSNRWSDKPSEEKQEQVESAPQDEEVTVQSKPKKAWTKPAAAVAENKPEVKPTVAAKASREPSPAGRATSPLEQSIMSRKPSSGGLYASKCIDVLC
jgi:hypothetical protein